MPDAKVLGSEAGGLGTSPPVRFTVYPVGNEADDADNAGAAVPAAAAATASAAADVSSPPRSMDNAMAVLPSAVPSSTVQQPPPQPSAAGRRRLVSQVSRTSRTSESNRSTRSFQSNLSDLTCPSENGVGILSLANDVNSILGSSILMSNPAFAEVCSDVTVADSVSMSSAGQTLGSSPRDDEEGAHANGHGNGFGREKVAAVVPPAGSEGAGSGAMVDLIDNPEYIDTLEGRLPLAEAAKMIARDSLVAAVGSGLVTPESVRRECYSKVLAVSFCFMFLYSAFFACRNLQTSITADEVLGHQTLAALYALSWIGAVCGYPLMIVMRPSWAIVSAMLPCLLYVGANFYQATFTLLPAALLQGLALGIMWAAEGVYMVNVAAVYAATFDESYYAVVARFNTIFYTIYQTSCVVGNVVASILLDQVNSPAAASENVFGVPAPDTLLNGTTPANLTDIGGSRCGASYLFVAGARNSTGFSLSSGHLAAAMDDRKRYTVLAVFAAFVGCGVLTAAVFLRNRRGDRARLEAVTASHLPLTRRKSGPAWRALRRSLSHLGSVLADAGMLLMAPCIVYLGFSGSLLLGDYSKAFISCQYGIGAVGYIYLVGAVLGVAGSFLSGLLSRLIGRIWTVSAALAFSASSLIAIRLWEPTANLTAVAFIPAVLWFFSDAVISSLLNALLGVLFKERLLAACAAFLLFFGAGLAIGALCSAYMWLTIAIKVYLALALLAIGLIGYVVLELLIRRHSLFDRP